MSLPQLAYQYIRPPCSSERHGVANGRPGTEFTPSNTLSNVLSTMYRTPFAASQGYGAFLPYSTDVAILNQLGAHYELKDSPGIQHPGLSHHPSPFYPYGQCQFGDPNRPKNATRESTSTLKAWLSEHRKNPYPTKGEKIMLAIITKMTLTQVSTWFANARRRLKKENKMTWVPKSRTDEEDNGYPSDNDGEGDKEDDEEIDLENIDAEKVENKEDSDYQDANSERKLADKNDSDISDDNEDMLHHEATHSDHPAKENKSSYENPVKQDDNCFFQPAVTQSSHESKADHEALHSNSPPPQKPKIWSLAETATTPDSPRKSPLLNRTSALVPHPVLATQKSTSGAEFTKLPSWTKLAFSSHQIALNGHYLELAKQFSLNNNLLYRHRDGKDNS
ncbi:hypothetical protein ACEWY4_010657 [Coilia grayii]|uniref:Homeobox domain-containing protein n=1 Tax=Coilia grayii TaxID=363190 RepID=A0ABD1K2K0_9TELE